MSEEVVARWPPSTVKHGRKLQICDNYTCGMSQCCATSLHLQLALWAKHPFAVFNYFLKLLRFTGGGWGVSLLSFLGNGNGSSVCRAVAVEGHTSQSVCESVVCVFPCATGYDAFLWRDWHEPVALSIKSYRWPIEGRWCLFRF